MFFKKERKVAMEKEDKRIQYLKEINTPSFDTPKIQQWDVVDSFERHVGKVDDILIDTKDETIRYIDVELDDNVANQKNELFKNPNVKEIKDTIHMLVPIGTVRMDKENKRLISDEINQNIIDRGPLHRRGDKITPEYERNVVGLVKEADTGTPKNVYVEKSGSVNDEFYKGSYFDVDRFFNRT